MKISLKLIPLSGKILISIIIVYFISGIVKQSIFWGGCYNARENFLIFGVLTALIFSLIEMLVKKIKKIPLKNSLKITLISFFIIIFLVVINSLGSACPR